jgi:Kef-type K+ transport system membrane component KefB
MTDIPVLRDLGLILVAGAICVLLARRLRAPTIVAYIVAGLVLGPATGLLGAAEPIELIAEIGIVLLLFLVGLELSLEKIRDVGRTALIAGIGQIVLTTASGFGIASLLGFDVVGAFFIGLALTFSSTVVVVKLLGQKEELDTLYGRIAIGIFLVQDVVVIVALTFLAGFGGRASVTVSEIGRGLLTAFAGMAVLLGAALLSARYVLPRLFGWAAASPDTLFIWSLCWCFLFVLGAEVFHLSAEIGAFLAGISLAQLPFNDDLRRRVRPLTNFFVAVFFVSLGIRMRVGDAADHWIAAIVLSVFVLIGTPVIIMWILARLGYGERTSFLSSVTLAQVSEFSFIFAAVGASLGVIDDAILALIAVVGLVTIALSAYMILYNHQLYNWTRRSGLLGLFRARSDLAVRRAGAELSGHIIVVGINSLGRRIVEQLVERGEQVLALDSSPANLRGLRCHTKLGNAEFVSVLEEAGIRRAKLLVSALQIEETNHLLAYWGRAFEVPTSIHAFDQTIVEELQQAGADHLIMSKSAGLRRVAEAFHEAGIFE